MPDELPDELRVPTMCGVCGRVGAFDTRTRTHEHAAQDLPGDHPFVPVKIADAPEQLRARCDFCNAEDSCRWELPCEDFPICPRLDGRWQWSRGAWAACDVCAVLLRNRDWPGLTSRAVDERIRRGVYQPQMRPYVRREFAALYREVRRHSTGPVRLESMTDREII